MKEKTCVLCNKKTPYKKTTYVDGSGQLCDDCYDKTYLKYEKYGGDQ